MPSMSLCKRQTIEEIRSGSEARHLHGDRKTMELWTADNKMRWPFYGDTVWSNCQIPFPVLMTWRQPYTY